MSEHASAADGLLPLFADAPVAAIRDLSPTSPSWRRVAVDGNRVRYVAVGSGPPALFCHGWGLRPNAYLRSIEAMAAAGCRVVRPRPAGVRRHP